VKQRAGNGAAPFGLPSNERTKLRRPMRATPHRRERERVCFCVFMRHRRGGSMCLSGTRPEVPAARQSRPRIGICGFDVGAADRGRKSAGTLVSRKSAGRGASARKASPRCDRASERWEHSVAAADDRSTDRRGRNRRKDGLVRTLFRSTETPTLRALAGRPQRSAARRATVASKQAMACQNMKGRCALPYAETTGRASIETRSLSDGHKEADPCTCRSFRHQIDEASERSIGN
jgi:hypothetical protein